ncbi:MAG: hypothetical protein HP494_15900 [Nitrospira sp.]|nr:hypothetical protein [Nitrospira sp.]
MISVMTPLYTFDVADPSGPLIALPQLAINFGRGQWRLSYGRYLRRLLFLDV